jgi:hypothetical protein
MASVHIWDCEAVCKWLEESGLASLTDTFRGNCILFAKAMNIAGNSCNYKKHLCTAVLLLRHPEYGVLDICQFHVCCHVDLI